MAQDGLVLELQRDALNPDVRCSDLLRKALVVSTKLEIDEIVSWINLELDGYTKNTPEADYPEYRMIFGRVEVFNPYHGFQPLEFDDPEDAETFNRRLANQPIPELERLLQSESKTLQMPFSERATKHLMNRMGGGVRLRPTLLVANTHLTRVVEAVRNLILKWSLDLEKSGISGEGMSFTKQEQTSANAASYNVVNNIGNMSNSQLQQQSPESNQIQTNGPDIEALKEFLILFKSKEKQLDLCEEDKAEVDAEISTLEIQVASPKPKSKILSESLGSIRRVIEGAGGGAAAAGIIEAISLLMS